MPKPELREPFASLESDLFATMQAGLHEWRKDLDYPESFSDFQACFRALFRMYEVKRRPLAIGMDEIEVRVGLDTSAEALCRFPNVNPTYPDRKP